MEFEIVMFRDWEAIVGHLLFLSIFYLYIYYFYLKMVMKFGNFGHESHGKVVKF